MNPGKFLAAGLLACTTATAENPADAVKGPLLPKEGEAVLLFLLDNSASLPPLDPEVQRREAIEKIYTFLAGQPYRLVLFGGRDEIFIDAPQHYKNSGQWTDFYFAFDATRGLIAEYPEGTEFKIVLITDGKIDPSPEDWTDQQVPPGADLKSVSGERTIELLATLREPLYVIVIGQDVDLPLIQRMVVAANGEIAASEYAQGIADFFADDGMLLRRFIFRVEANEGLEKIEPVVTRIATPPSPRLELYISSSLLLAIAMLVGVGVRSFPGAGDREVVELRTGEPVHVAVDRLRRLSSDVPAWSWKGLSLVESSKSAVAMLTAQEDSVTLPPTGFALEGLDAASRALIVLRLPELRERLEALAKDGNKDEQIYALNLEYVAKDMEEPRVERLLMSSPSERKKFSASDFLRAKVHLLHNEKLAKKLTGACVVSKIYGLNAQEQELRPGSKIQLGRYEFRVDELTKGGRKDLKLGLSYERVPSPLFLKRLVPASVQRALRLRRSHERVVR
ncbi:MAG TPA: hypothetical protein VJ921_09655 [Vicinamibacteria bacterium]|nr:hypothetical protein [Vicinamibacteria bacterium]